MATLSLTGAFTGRLTYISRDNASVPAVLGVPNAQISGWCYNLDGVPNNPSSAVTDADGNFSLFCFDDAPGYAGTVFFANGTVNVRGREGAAAGGDFWMEANANPTIQVANDNAARVFVNYNTYATAAPARFGRSRSLINYNVSEGPAYASHYEPANDRILIGPGAVWGDYGRFTAVHEYGHAFHYAAVEPWASYMCSADGTHAGGTAYTLSCAFVEGFADFFAATLIDPANNQFGAQSAEVNFWRNGDGVLIENAFASYLRDMVDGPSDNDLTAGDDESIQMPLSTLLTVMSNCSPGGAVRLDGSDQVIACIEQSTNPSLGAPAVFRPSWRSFSSIGWVNNAPPLLPPQASVRNNWQYNLYNTVPTP